MVRLSLAGSKDFRWRGKCKVKTCSLSWLALDPNPASMHLDDPLDKRQPNTCTLALRVQFIEQAEDTLMIFRGNAQAIIFDEENGLVILWVLPFLSDLDARIWLIPHVFRRV